VSDPLWAQIIPSTLSGASLIAVVGIGWRTLKATNEATEVTRRAGRATERSANATELAEKAARESLEATRQSVQATRRLATATERGESLRRLERVLDVVIEMRQTFNQIYGLGDPDLVDSQPQAFAKLALSRKLQAAMVLVEDAFTEGTAVYGLGPQQQPWSSTLMEQAILEVKTEMRSVSA
jgi:hypothetical protein